MNILLIFFALPIAVIIISIALQKILKCPALVAAIIFAIFLIVTFIISDLIFLVATIIYTIISFITAYIVFFICRFLRRRNCEDRDEHECCYRCRENCCNCNRQRNGDNLLTISSNCGNNNDGKLLTISSNGCNGVRNELLTVNTNCNTNSDDTDNCNCCNNTEITGRNGVNARISVIPNNNGESGCICGRFRRR